MRYCQKRGCDYPASTDHSLWSNHGLLSSMLHCLEALPSEAEFWIQIYSNPSSTEYWFGIWNSEKKLFLKNSHSNKIILNTSGLIHLSRKTSSSWRTLMYSAPNRESNCQNILKSSNIDVWSKLSWHLIISRYIVSTCSRGSASTYQTW